MDCSLIANECIDSRSKEGKAGVICKIDMEKAYDHVNWKFLDRILQKMRFGVMEELDESLYFISIILCHG